MSSTAEYSFAFDAKKDLVRKKRPNVIARR
jgi:hypothetical protein